MSPRLALAIDAAYRAGRSTLAYFQSGVEAEIKADNSPVTIADREAERMIRRLIGETFPADAILGEEEGGAFDADDRWVVDPIDGTKSFLAGVPLYATLVAYEQDGMPIVGACYFPALDEMFYAERGSGCFLNGRMCRVSRETDLARSTLSCGGPKSMLQYGRWEGFAALSQGARATRTWCDAYGHALVAAGRVEAMLDPIVSRWDLSAVRILVEEAGGSFTDFAGGEPFARGSSGLEAVSSNGAIHDTVLLPFRPDSAA